MYIFLDGSDHCNTFDSFGFVISCCFGGLARKSTAYKEQAKDAATCHPSKHRFSSMVGWIQFVFHHNFSGFDGQYFHVNILVSHIQCRVVHEGWKCFTVRSNFDDVMIWLEIVVLLTHHVTFLYLLQYFHPLLLGISWHITNIQWPACPGIAAATFYVSAWYCPRWVDDQLSSLTFEWRRQLQIWPDRILPVLYLLNLLNTLIFWVTFPCCTLPRSRRMKNLVWGITRCPCPLLAIGEFSSHGADYQAGFLWVCHCREALWPVPLRRPSWDCWTSCVMERASGPSLARLTEFTLRNSTVSEYGMIWQLIQFD